MAIKSICKMGSLVLANPSLPVGDVADEEIVELVKDMYETMVKANGVGIAAPQIGVGKRVIIVGFERSDRYPDEEAVPLSILVNPTIEVLDYEMIEEWEGCLSLPGLRGVVPRYKKVKYSGYDLEGNEVTGIAEGFHARIFQHECDHIDGVLYPQRMKDLRTLGYEDELLQRMYDLEKKPPK